MTLDPNSPLAAPRWTVLDYDGNVLAHRVVFAEALSLLFDILSGAGDDEAPARYWPLFSLSRDPIPDTDRGERRDGLMRTGGLSSALVERGGLLVDIRDTVAVDPALDIGGAAECIYYPFRNIDLCEVAYRDLEILMSWPADRVNHIAELDPLWERHLRERHAAALADGVPVHLVFDRTRLTHLDELHMWVIRQIFYFHACPLGQYAEPDQVYGLSHLPHGQRVVLAFGCAPHAHDMAASPTASTRTSRSRPTSPSRAAPSSPSSPGSCARSRRSSPRRPSDGCDTGCLYRHVR